MKPLKKLGPATLPVLCYLLVIAIWLVVCTTNAGTDAVRSANGSLQPYTLAETDFVLVDIEVQPDGSLYTTSNDPQMLWQVPVGQRVNTLRFAAEFSAGGHEMCLYYAAPGDVDEAGEYRFSDAKRVWPQQQADGSYLFHLPRQSIAALRLDAVSVKYLTMEFNGIWLNESQPLWQYYNPGVYGLLGLIFGPALLAAGLQWAFGCLAHILQHRAKKKGTTA